MATSSSTSSPSAGAVSAMAAFDATTSRWGRLTMLVGLLVSLIGPTYLIFFAGLDVSVSDVVTAFLAVAATFAVFWVLEPVTYFPVLGPAAMYQAFMIGNISNKLLPAAVVAQSSVDAKPGTKRGDLAAVMAICGAATVHLSTLLVFVGLLGTWLITVIPEETIAVARLYILPSLMGAVLVQTIWTLKQWRTTVIAIVIALLVQFTIVPLWDKAVFYSVAIAVFLTVIAAWLLRDRDAQATPEQIEIIDAEERRR